MNYKEKYLEKKEQTFYFEGDSLLFAAIFSEKGIYDCQVKRLMQRTSELIKIYSGKNNLLFERGCQSNFQSELQSIQNFAENLNTPKDFNSLGYILKEIEDKNKYSNCALW